MGGHTTVLQSTGPTGRVFVVVVVLGVKVDGMLVLFMVLAEVPMSSEEGVELEILTGVVVTVCVMLGGEVEFVVQFVQDSRSDASKSNGSMSLAVELRHSGPLQGCGSGIEDNTVIGGVIHTNLIMLCVPESIRRQTFE